MLTHNIDQVLITVSNLYCIEYHCNTGLMLLVLKLDQFVSSCRHHLDTNELTMIN